MTSNLILHTFCERRIRDTTEFKHESCGKLPTNSYLSKPKYDKQLKKQELKHFDQVHWRKGSPSLTAAILQPIEKCNFFQTFPKRLRALI